MCAKQSVPGMALQHGLERPDLLAQNALAVRVIIVVWARDHMCNTCKSAGHCSVPVWRTKREQAAEAPDRWIDLLDAPHELVASIDVHTSRLVVQRSPGCAALYSGCAAPGAAACLLVCMLMTGTRARTSTCLHAVLWKLHDEEPAVEHPCERLEGNEGKWLCSQGWAQLLGAWARRPANAGYDIRTSITFALVQRCSKTSR